MPNDPKPKSIRERVRHNLFFIIVAVTTLGFFGMIGPYILTCFWAAALAVIFYGLYRRIRSWVGEKREGMASAITTVLIFFFVIIPFTLLSIALVNQAIGLIAAIQAGELDVMVVIDYVENNIPVVSGYLETFGVSADELRDKLSVAVVEGGQFLANGALSVTGNVFNIFIQFTLALYLIYFFLKDGRAIVATMIDTIPMGNIRERTLFQRFAQVARATLKGTLIVAFVQGAIGGVLFAVLGIPAALLWGVAMMLLALLPVGGSAIVWFPAAIILFIQGFVGKAIVIVIVGTLIIGLIDNLLRPLLVGRDTQMPDYLVLISTLGGITLFGLSGFVVGPTVAALFVTVWEIMGKDYGGKRI